MESELKDVGSKLINEIIKLQMEKVQTLDTFQKAISHKAYSKTKLSIFKQESEELSNMIATAKEKRDAAKVLCPSDLMCHFSCCLFYIFRIELKSFQINVIP